MLLVIATVIKVLLIPIAFVMGSAAVLGWAERRQSAMIQDRLGPNRADIGGVRAFGLIQLLADSVKLAFKEDFEPAHGNRFLFAAGPFLALMAPMMVFVFIPFGPGDLFVISRSNIGALFILAVLGFGVYGAALGGWASYNNFSLIGALRAMAQMVSFELAVGLSIVGIFMIYGTLSLQEIIVAQGDLIWGFIPKWGIVTQPLGFLLFLLGGVGMSARAPFDLAEAESGLISGHFTEFSALRFVMFYLGAFVEIVVVAAIGTVLFLGGWQIPWISSTDGILLNLLQVGTTLGKIVFLCWVQMMIRWTYPRFRYDQVLHFGWVYLLPVALVNIFITGLVLFLM